MEQPIHGHGARSAVRVQLYVISKSNLYYYSTGTGTTTVQRYIPVHVPGSYQDVQLATWTCKTSR